MAKTEETSAAPAPSRVETEVATPQVSSVTFGGDGPEAKTTDELSNSLDLGEPEGELDEGAEDQPEGDKPEGEGDEAGEPEADALPDYDPENEEVRAQYDARYFKDGELDRAALSSEFWASFAKADGDVSKAGLSEGAYAYLKDTLGVTKEMAKDLEAGLVAKHKEDQQTFFQRFGGVERYNRAITWAKGGGYSEDQQARFRAAYDRGGADRDDAVDALMNRFHRSTGGGNKDARRGPPGRRSSTPERDATGGGASRPNSGGDRFKNSQEHQAASQEARREYKQAEEIGDKAAMKKASEKSKAIYQKARRGYLNR